MGSVLDSTDFLLDNIGGLQNLHQCGDGLWITQQMTSPRPLTCATHAAKPPIETYRKAKTYWSYLDFQVFYHHISWFLYMFLFWDLGPLAMLKTVRTCQDRKAATALVSGYTRRNNAKPWVLEARPCASVLCNRIILKASSGWKSVSRYPACSSFSIALPFSVLRTICSWKARNSWHQHDNASIWSHFESIFLTLVLQKFHEISTICLIFFFFCYRLQLASFCFRKISDGLPHSNIIGWYIAFLRLWHLGSCACQIQSLTHAI